ncbi:LOW QUALITY PROTEIN: WD repeat-containing protein 49-like [Melanotaenia boesemani]|uniref:LOW QUALITY PROTEIN: WD repeat-containing protein 49-like n=1 Tax=Melanotaenia boesemani TaxID=1250792 RepID=UPI001C04E619|nr:LOW QUALITY PROTEIN: WD repeat-containing protein 49-like [Melanotaenia boesemani]
MGTRMEVAQLESRLNTEDYKKLQSLFLDSSGIPCSLSRDEFVNLAWTSVGCGSKEEYGLLFDSVVATQVHHSLLLGSDGVEEGRVDWGGLCSFLMLELSEKVKNRRAISVPRWKPPLTLICPHRDPIQKVLYLQSSGQYLTVSKRGTVVQRDGEDMSILQTHRLQNSSVTPKDLWVTDMVLLQNVHMIAVSFTCKQVCFYDTLSKQDFSCNYKIQGLMFSPWCLDYWVDPFHPNQAVLTIGDIGGQVSALYFTSAQISLFERLSSKTESDSADAIQWDELVKGKYCSCYIVTHTAHAPSWVRKVRYLGSLEAIVSCSTKPESSMVIGWREKESRSLRAISYATKRGVWDVDYHCELSLIATAGVDHQVLLWNPYVISGPLFVLIGHSSPVTAVNFTQTKQQLLSFSKDKVLCQWDLSSQVCIHRLAGVFPKTQENTHVVVFLQEEHQHLLLSFNSQLLLLETLKVEKKTSSHEHPVTCVLYNSLFRQVVSSDSASSVICWLADTGLSTMALDGTQTRLFTAGADGEVKVWDFSGHCLHRMNAGLGRAVDISQVLLLRRSILVMGWKRMLTVFHMHSFSRSIVEPFEWNGGVQHRGSILCAAFQPPQTLVTGSVDGEIIVWNSNSEKALKKLQQDTNHKDCKKQQGGADLVSCDGLGRVRLWNIQHSRLVGRFTAYSRDLGSIVMTVSPCGKYLVTANREGTIKTWDIEQYCLKSDEEVNENPPKLLHSFRPHLDHVTHLEICTHGDRLLLLSSSSDCSVALSYLLGETVGLCGQDDIWSLETNQAGTRVTTEVKETLGKG